MKISKLLMIIIMSLFFIATECDEDCLTMRDNNTLYLDFQVLEASPPYTDFEVVRTIQLTRLRKPFSLVSHLDHPYNRLTADNSTLLLQNKSEVNFLNVAGNDESNPLFKEQNILRYTNLNYAYDLDLDNSNKRYLGINTGDENHQIVEISFTDLVSEDWSDKSEISETLIDFHNVMLGGDSIYIKKEVSALRYTSDGGIFYKLSTYEYDYDPDDHPDYNFIQPLNENHFLIKYQNDQSDTLFNSPNGIDVKSGSEFILISEVDDSVSVINYEGELVDKNKSRIARISPTGKSFTTYNYWYYNVEKDTELNFGEFIKNNAQIYPFDEKIFIVDSLEVKVLDVQKNEIVHEINASHFPSIPSNEMKNSKKLISFPFITNDGKIRLLYIDTYYFDDPYDKCDLTPVSF